MIRRNYSAMQRLMAMANAAGHFCHAGVGVRTNPDQAITATNIKLATT